MNMQIEIKQCYCGGACSRAANAFELLAQDKRHLAYREAVNALADTPNCARLNGVLGLIHSTATDGQYALSHFHKVMEIEGESANVLCNIAYAEYLIGKLDCSFDHYIKALAIEPKNTLALSGLSKVLELKDATDTAIELQNRAFIINPSEHFLRLNMASTLEKADNLERACAILQHELITPMERLALGRLQEKQGKYSLAWGNWQIANAHFARTHPYNRDNARKCYSSHMNFATKERLLSLPSVKNNSGFKPIFVLGYPRSGTTMLDQIIASHSEIDGGDELPFIFDIAAIISRVINSPKSYPFALSEIAASNNHAILDMMQSYYISKVEYLGFGKQSFTDKMPLNEMHLPLIHSLFPNSPMIFIRRHPLDCIVSNYSLFLTHGFNQSFDLVSCAEHYVMNDTLFMRYRDRMKNLSLMEIKYEHLVVNLENYIVRLCDFLSVEHQPGMRDFHKSKRHSRTASYAQVKKPINKNAIGRWQHYARELKEIIPIIRPICEREGYTL